MVKRLCHKCFVINDYFFSWSVRFFELLQEEWLYDFTHINTFIHHSNYLMDKEHIEMAAPY